MSNPGRGLPVFYWSCHHNIEVRQMALVVLIFSLGIILIIVGIRKREEGRGKWFVAAGIAVILLAVILVGYGDVKTGFMDALND